MLSIVMMFSLFAVIVLSLAAGVGLGYLIILGILSAFDRSRQSIKAAQVGPLTTSAGHS